MAPMTFSKKDDLQERRRLFSLIGVMAIVSVLITGTAIYLLYIAAFEVTRERLVDTVKIQSFMMEAVADFDAIYSTDYPDGAKAATLSQIIDANEHFEGLGETGEIILAERKDDKIVFLLDLRHSEIKHREPISFESELAQPMRLALQGRSGSIVGLDYRGEQVLAVYEPVRNLEYGIVAKMDIIEVRAPFIRASFITFGILLFLVTVGAIIINRITNPILIELQKSKEAITKSRNQLRELSQRLESIREQERTEIARDIHDDLGQSLTALKLDISSIMKNSKDKDLIRKTESMSALVDSTIKTIQKVVARLRPGILDDLGLISALEWQLEEFQNRSGVKCEIEHGDVEFELDSERSTTLFRIFQELLTNIARHARASKVNVQLGIKDDILTLIVNDNGIGISEEDKKDSKSYGIMGISERLIPWNGNFEITGNKEDGTKAIVTLPLKNENDK